MIWILSTCKEKLSELEFVKPVKEIVEKFDEVKIIKMEDKPEEGKVIITGTALADLEYFKKIEKFRWIKDYKDAVLGISSGAQIIAKVFNIELVPIKKIGVFETEIFKRKEKAYFLTSYLARNGEYSIGFSAGLTSAFRVGNKYGVFFHPEVLNRWIIESFVSKDELFL